MQAFLSNFTRGGKGRPWRAPCRAAVLLATLTAWSVAVGQTTFVVNSVGDDGQDPISSGVFCHTGGTMPPQVPECTLRAALESANDASGPVVIQFSQSIPVSNGRSQITVSTGLPFINNQVTIDGTTHPEYQPGTDAVHVTINYIGSASNVSGIRFSNQGGGSGSIVRAIGILGFPGSGILLNGGEGYILERNQIGRVYFRTGMAVAPIGGHGIDVNGASDTGVGVTQIRNNSITRTGGDAIHVRNGARATFIFSNIIGLRPSGGSYMPVNTLEVGGAGVHIASTAGDQNFIGGLGPNVITNAVDGGIIIRADNQTITSNLIGLPPGFQVHPNHQMSDYANGGTAIVLESSNNTVGGAGSATNYIGNSPSVQIRVGNGGSSPIVANNNQIRANYIGVTPDGEDVGTEWGVRIDNGDNTSIRNAIIAHHGYNITARGSGNVIQRNTLSDASVASIEMLGTGQIGSENANDANLMIGNGIGIWVKDTGGGITHIRNNFIGVDEDGTDLGNTTGIRVSEPGNLVNIFENTIGFNTYAIHLNDSASGTWIQGNLIGELANGMPAPNGTGVWMRATAQQQQVVDHLIGGSTSTDLSVNPQIGNVIANSTSYGVILEQLSNGNLERVTMRGNTFRNNATGITLWPGMTAIDPGGGSDGPNGYLNWPEFDEDETSLDLQTGQLHYRFRVDTTSANASYPLFIDFYRHSGDAAAQGEDYLGSVVYPASSAAQWISGSLQPVTPLSLGDEIVATASDSDGNTSQFTIEPVGIEPDLPALVASPASIDFGEHDLGVPASPVLVTISNQGEGELLIGSLSIAGPNAGDFGLLAPVSCSNSAVSPGSSCEFEVIFTSQAPGIRQAWIQLPSNDPTGPHQVQLTGTHDVIFDDRFQSE